MWACGKDKWLIECETVLGAVPEFAEDEWWFKCGGELGSLLIRTEFGDGEEGGDVFGTPKWDIPLKCKTNIYIIIKIIKLNKIMTYLLCANGLDQFNADESPISDDVRSVKIPW